MKKILITGASGFVGSFLVPKLIENNYKILVISRSPELISDKYGEKVIACKVENEEVISKFSPEIAVNLATFSTASDDLESQKKMIDANIIFLSRLLHVLKFSKNILFINTGTFAEYFSNNNELDPAYFYSATKTAGRYLIKYYSQAYSFKTVHVTPYSLYGPKDARKKLIHFLIDSLNTKTPIKTTKGEQVLDFLYITDLIDLYMKIIEKSDLIEDGVEFKGGTGIGTSVKDLVSIIEKITNKTANIEWGALPYRKRDTMMAIANSNTAETILNWKPRYNLEQGLKQMLKTDRIL
jgi:nucleoside-diphosphate-sugar epimerase